MKTAWTSIVMLLFLLIAASQSRAGWFDAGWQYRRPITIQWDDEHPTGEDMATAVFYTDGHSLPNGEDIRVATEEGKLVASHVLMVGPGDRMRIAFAMQKNVKDYEIYFGNPKPAPPPEGLEDVHYKAGVVIETRQWTGGAITNFDQIEKSFARSKPILGKMIVDGLFLGYNPFGPQEQWISKFSGSLFAPIDGDYVFAVAADDAAGLYIDDKPLVFAFLGGGDIRYHASIHLPRGRHDLMAYHVNFAGPGYISVGWKRPDATKVEVVRRESFGVCFSGLIGPMEEHGKTLVADFAASQESECFFNDSYSFHYHFSSKSKGAQANKFRWSFGDGQTSDEAEVDHVYVREGVYPVKLLASIGPNSDTQTCQLVVGRNYSHILEAREEPAKIYAGITQLYNLDSIPADEWVRLMQLYFAAEKPDPATGVAQKVAAASRHADVAEAFSALAALSQKRVDDGQARSAVDLWDRVPVDADIQPSAAVRGAELALWWTGDFAKAVKLLKPFESKNDPQVRRLYGEALILCGKADEGRKVLQTLGSPIAASRKAALSGAAARSVEFFITEKDTESGEEAWDRWQMKFPTDFIEGYSVVLRCKLMEQRKCSEAAAKLAEAFAIAQPQSPYAPQLLDRASNLLSSADPAKSKALRQLLKQKYPEDPLSQN